MDGRPVLDACSRLFALLSALDVLGPLIGTTTVMRFPIAKPMVGEFEAAAVARAVPGQ